MNELKVDYSVTGKFQEDSRSKITFANRKSAKNGATFRQFLNEMETFWLQLNKEHIKNLYERGDIDEQISNGRRIFKESKGIFGISRAEALRRYKLVYANLPKELLLKHNPTYDQFTDRELGIE